MKFDESGFDTPADKGMDDDRVINYVQIKVRNDDDGSDDINSVLQISNDDLSRTPEKINIERHASADNGYDDDMVI